MHQIAKINHCETTILGGKGIAVKLTARQTQPSRVLDSGWNSRTVLLETLEVRGDGVFGHALGFGKRSSVGYARRQHRHQGGKTTLGFGPKHDIEVGA